MLRQLSSLFGKTKESTLFSSVTRQMFNPARRQYSNNIAETLRKNAAVSVSLNKIKDNAGARKKSRQIARGQGSGHGKKSGRGDKGQRSRSGRSVAPGFEGGQTPLFKRMRKFGFRNMAFKRTYAVVNLGQIQSFVDRGHINPNEVITMRTLIDSGCVGKLRRNDAGVKILSDGAEVLKTPLKLEVSQISKKALEAIEKVGGKVDLLYYNTLGLRALLKPNKFERMPYLPPPPPKINGKLDMKMRQPEQFPEWRKQQELAKKLLEKLQTEAK